MSDGHYMLEAFTELQIDQKTILRKPETLARHS